MKKITTATVLVYGDFFEVRKIATMEATPRTMSDTKAMRANSSCYSIKSFETPAIFSTVSSAASPVK